MAVRHDARTYAERQGDKRTAGVSRRKAMYDRAVKVAQQTRKHALGGDGAARLIAIAEVAEHDRRRTIQHPRQPQLRQHAIDPERALADIFQKKHVAVRRIERVRCTKRRNELRKRPTHQWPRGLTRLERLEPRRRELTERLRARQGAEERVAVVCIDAAAEPAIEHRSMKRHDAATPRQVREHRRQVAVPDERLRRLPQIFFLEKRQQMHAAIAAAYGDERANRWIAPCREKCLGPYFALAGKIAAVLREHALFEDRLETEPADFENPLVEFFTNE